MRIVSPGEMGEIDKRAHSEFNYPPFVLMENAGIKLFNFFTSRFLSSGDTERPILFAAGGGNNGGDVLVMARQALLSGRDNIAVIMAGSRENGTVSAHRLLCSKIGIRIINFEDQPETADKLIAEAGLIVDGITGTGLKGALRSPYKELVKKINGSGAFIVSIDIPSGIGEGFTDQFTAVRADVTLTVGLPKLPLYLPYARRLCGEIFVVPIGFPPALLIAEGPGGELISENDLPALLPDIEPSTYKNKRGSLAVFAGSAGTGGAAFLSACAAARSRAGLVTLFLDKDVYLQVAGRLGAVMAVNWDPAGDPGGLDYSRFTAILAGPGWGKEGRKPWLDKFLNLDIPGVMDADGINLIERPESGIDLGNRWVITPHPGEFCRLMGISIEELKSAAIDYLLKGSRELNAVIVLKSHVTYIGAPDGNYWIADGMNPALATAGTGDLLAGIIAGFLAGGIRPSLAARLGVLIHARAGRIGFEKFGWFLAEDLLELLSNNIKKQLPGGV